MIHSLPEFLEWQRQQRIYWGVRRREWLYGPEGLCRWLYARMIHGQRRLNLENPTSFCDKLNWLKFHYHVPELKIFADKAAVRGHVAERLGPEWLIPLLGVYVRPQEIPWDELPDAFVLKATHGSAMNVLCPDKSKLDRGLAVRWLRRWLRRDFYRYGMEWCYQGLPRRILCETFLRGEDGLSPWDYKVLCFGGEPRTVWVDVDRHRGTSAPISTPIGTVWPAAVPGMKPPARNSLVRRSWTGCWPPPGRFRPAIRSCAWISTRFRAACFSAKSPCIPAGASNRSCRCRSTRKSDPGSACRRPMCENGRRLRKDK